MTQINQAPPSHSPAYEAGGSDPDFYLPPVRTDSAGLLAKILRNTPGLSALLPGSR